MEESEKEKHEETEEKIERYIDINVYKCWVHVSVWRGGGPHKGRIVEERFIRADQLYADYVYENFVPRVRSVVIMSGGQKYVYNSGPKTRIELDSMLHEYIESACECICK